MNHDTKLAEMIATRLCHDLTGPIGAVNNGVEFLDEEGFDMQNEAVQLILSSAHEAVNRLMFYRQAYGRVGESGESSLAEKKKITVDFFSGTKIKVDWPDSHTDASGVAISQKMSRLLLNLLIIAGGSAIRGGTLSVRVALGEDGEKQIDISVTGETIKLDTDTTAILNNTSDDVSLTPKTAQPFLAMQLAQELRANVAFNVDGGTLTIRLTQPQMAMANAS
ncbi:MAG: histidine phosphotransferase family protein [Rickettsiales bacterium]